MSAPLEAFATSLQHILAELERIDLLIQLQVWRARQLHQVDEQFQGIYIPEEEVDELLASPAGLPAWALASLPLEQPQVQQALDQLLLVIAGRKAAAKQKGITLRLDQLQQIYQLSTIELDILLIALAPEIDLRYERLFGYLQDDITKRRPSVDLALNLLSASFAAKLSSRSHFTHQAPLIRHRIVQLFDDPSQPHPPLLSRYLKVDERVVDYLFDIDTVATTLSPYVEVVIPEKALNNLLLPNEIKVRLAQLLHYQQAAATAQLLYFQGPYGVGKATTAAALCQQLGKKLLVVAGERLLESTESAFAPMVQLIVREAILQHAVIYWTGFDDLLRDERQPWCQLLIDALAEQPTLSILAGNTSWEPKDLQRPIAFVRIEFPRFSSAERRHFWPLSLNGNTADEVDFGVLAAKFRFSPGQIRDAAVTAQNLARWRDPTGAQITMADLYAASRLQSNRKLAELARKITPHYTWSDIVLPPDRMRQLHEIVNQVKYRSKVYDEWGFDRKLAMGKGLNALFMGPSGTGKTMAADIMAGELGLDLYKIDLSNVVSKYIGETEKNLARIFAEAEASNAILFFDEADALFGKRSEVRDSHDRYANIETSYLLQRMEEYDGMTILATNLSKNLDDAFVRRMHFTIEFPFPDHKQRRRIWEKIWPTETPIVLPSANSKNSQPMLPRLVDGTEAIDLDFMAQRFDVAGGNIRNIALAAAFLAADDGEIIRMDHLIRATQREYQKMGKVIVDSEFGEYGRFVKRET